MRRPRDGPSLITDTYTSGERTHAHGRTSTTYKTLQAELELFWSTWAISFHGFGCETAHNGSASVWVSGRCRGVFSIETPKKKDKVGGAPRFISTR